MSGVIRGTKLDINNIEYGTVNQTKGGAKNIRMTVNKKPIVLQFPNGRIPFGLSCFESDGNAPKKYSLELSLGGDSKLDKFLEIVNDIDQRNIKLISDNSAQWLGSAKSKVVVEEGLYGKMVRPDKKGQDPSRIKVKLPMYNGKPLFDVFTPESGDKPHNFWSIDEDGKYNVDWSWAQNGMEATIIAKFEGIWIVNKNAYCTLRAELIKVTKKSSRIDYNSFMAESDEDKTNGEEEDEESDGSFIDDE